MSDNSNNKENLAGFNIEGIIRDSFGIDKTTQETIVIDYYELEAYTEFMISVILEQASKLVMEANFKPINPN